MKIAEFFVALGFDMSGEKQLDGLDEKLGDLAANAGKALAGFASMTAGMAVMLHQAIDTTNGFRQFKAVTGQSAEELQKWQYIASQAGIGGEEITSTIKAIQQQSADIAMGHGNPTPWAVLGLDPHTNPFDTIKKLREAVKDFSPAIARSMVESLGVGEGVFAMLRMTDQKFTELQKNFIVTDEQTKGINAISSAWAEVLWQINAVKNQLVAALAPSLKPVLDMMKVLLAKGAQFTKWLNGSSAGAKATRIALASVAAAIATITLGLTGLLAILGGISAAVAFWTVGTNPLTITIAAITAAIVLLVLIIEDFYTYLEGGDSIIGDFVEALNPLKSKLDSINKAFKEFDQWVEKKTGLSVRKLDQWKLGQDIKILEQMQEEGELDESDKKFLAKLKSQQAAGLVGDPSARLAAAAAVPSMSGMTNSNVTHIGPVSIDVKSPVDDPVRLGTAVADKINSLENTARQQPLPLTR